MFVSKRDVLVEWGDCDPAGIVFYPRYFAMSDASTTQLFAAALGHKKHEMIRRYGIIGMPMVDTHANFRIPSRFGDCIHFESRVTSFGRSSFDVHHTVFRPDGDIGLEVWEKRVWAGLDPENTDRIKGFPIPDEVIAALSASNE
jgi:4-hydroxybenzoyl-CoA thioesterase